MKIGLPRFSKSKQATDDAEEDFARHERIQATIDRAIEGFHVEPPISAVTEMRMQEQDCAQTVAA